MFGLFRPPEIERNRKGIEPLLGDGGTRVVGKSFDGRRLPARARLRGRAARFQSVLPTPVPRRITRNIREYARQMALVGETTGSGDVLN